MNFLSLLCELLSSALWEHFILISIDLISELCLIKMMLGYFVKTYWCIRRHEAWEIFFRISSSSEPRYAELSIVLDGKALHDKPKYRCWDDWEKKENKNNIDKY